MNREQFKVLVKGMKAVYAQPTFIPDKDAFDVWYELLKDLSYDQLNAAIQKYMITERFPPTIADLRTKALEIINPELQEMTEFEAWSITMKAISNSGYHAREEFEKLPKICQMAVGSLQNLREWAMMDSETLGTVEQSHFFRNYRAAVKRISEEQKIPRQVRELIGAVQGDRPTMLTEKASNGRKGSLTQRERVPPTEMSEEARRKLEEVKERLKRA